MPEATLIDGKATAASLRARVTDAVRDLHQLHDVTPGLAVVLIGDDPASHIYVRNKQKMAIEAGIMSQPHRLPADTSQADLLALIDRLNADPAVHGILVQLPLPGQMDAHEVIARIDPDKDVDGFHIVNAGRLAVGQNSMVPCTPLGCLILLKQTLGADLSGQRAVILGRSNIVGKPMAQLLLREGCTVTIAHSRTADVPWETRHADILVAAVGRPAMVRGDWVKPGATVIDVGINRLPPEPGRDKGRLIGDVAFDEVRSRARAITPVPGGVGPMTIACLLVNTVTCACRQNRLPDPDLIP